MSSQLNSQSHNSSPSSSSSHHSSSSSSSAHTIFPTPLYSYSSFFVYPIALFADNFSYLLIDRSTRQALLIDPADGAPVIQTVDQLKREGVIKSVVGILTTHKHWDHAGGNEVVKEQLEKDGPVKVYGSAIDSVLACTHPLNHGDELILGSGTRIIALHTPCHTTGHLCFYVTDVDAPKPFASISSSSFSSHLLFCGDTLFLSGCGRFFEGTASQMFSSLSLLASLPPSTVVWCGHEYSVANLEFAKWADDENEKVKSKLEWAKEEREMKRPVVGSTTIGEEKEINPFLRTNQSAIEKKVTKWMEGSQGEKKEIAVLHGLREAKNSNAHLLRAGL